MISNVEFKMIDYLAGKNNFIKKNIFNLQSEEKNEYFFKLNCQ